MLENFGLRTAWNAARSFSRLLCHARKRDTLGEQSLLESQDQSFVDTTPQCLRPISTSMLPRETMHQNPFSPAFAYQPEIERRLSLYYRPKTSAGYRKTPTSQRQLTRCKTSSLIPWTATQACAPPSSSALKPEYCVP